MLKFVRPIAILVAAAGVLAGCGGDGGGTTDPEPDPTNIRVTVRLDGTAEPGITVELFEPDGTTALESAETNGQGQVTFEDVTPGTYEVEIEVPAGVEVDGEARRAVTAAEGQTATATFDLVTPLPPGLVVVNMTASSFNPSEVEIAVGETIQWMNGSSVLHTVTPDGHSEWSGVNVDAGDQFEHTFDTAGSFPYLCQIHAGMAGTITVQ